MKLPAPPIILRVLLSKLKVLWRQWDVQTMVLSSFAFQLILFLLGPLRRQSSNRVIIVCVWLAYLLADWVAAQAIGLIGKGSTTTTTLTADDELYAFWAQFLLLHLGGPDTVTALAIEDSELWLRTGLHLAVQVYGSLGVLVRSFVQSQSSLWIPTLFMFVAGIVKYLERVSSLFHGRLLKFSNQDSDAWELRWKLDKYEPAEGVDDNDEEYNYRSRLTNVELTKHAFYFFHRFKRLYSASQDFMLDLELTSYFYFCNRTPEDAFRVMEIQFNFAYDVFYTKTGVICNTFSWKVLRLAVTLLEAGSLVIWLFLTDKQGFRDYNIRITYTLLFGAIAVDVFAFLRIQIWSDWTIVQDKDPSRIKTWLYDRLHSARKRVWAEGDDHAPPIWARLRRVLFRRWSDSVSQLSLIDMSLDHKSRKMKVILLLRLDQTARYVTHRWFSNRVRDFIFEDLIQHTRTSRVRQNICQVKGGGACMWLLNKYGRDTIAIPNLCKLFKIYEDYDMVVIRWHIITELCYNLDGVPVSNHDHDNVDADHNLDEEAAQPEATNMEEHNFREICKVLSQYMMYLLCNQEEMMPTVEDTDERLYTAYNRLTKALEDQAYESIEMGSAKRKNARCQMAYRLIRETFTAEDAKSKDVHGFPMEEIMGELRELEEKQLGKWEFMAKVWGELLYYAAIRCKPNLHAVKLKEGGELVSFVWLLLRQLRYKLNANEYDMDKDNTEPERDLLMYYDKDE